MNIYFWFQLHHLTHVLNRFMTKFLVEFSPTFIISYRLISSADGLGKKKLFDVRDPSRRTKLDVVNRRCKNAIFLFKFVASPLLKTWTKISQSPSIKFVYQKTTVGCRQNATTEVPVRRRSTKDFFERRLRCLPLKELLLFQFVEVNVSIWFRLASGLAIKIAAVDKNHQLMFECLQIIWITNLIVFKGLVFLSSSFSFTKYRKSAPFLWSRTHMETDLKCEPPIHNFTIVY